MRRATKGKYGSRSLLPERTFEPCHHCLGSFLQQMYAHSGKHKVPTHDTDTNNKISSSTYLITSHTDSEYEGSKVRKSQVRNPGMAHAITRRELADNCTDAIEHRIGRTATSMAPDN